MHGFEKWTEIYELLSEADQGQSLAPDKLEKLAQAAYMTGRDTHCFQVLERAFQKHLDQENAPNAIRCSFWLGLMHINAGERARGGGWIARGERLLNDLGNQDCPEKALFLIPKALGTLSAGNGSEAQQIFAQVVAAGEKFSDVDLIALGRLGLGQSMIQQGEIGKGISLLDETMITVETEDVFPLVNGIVYCAVIESCRKVWDLKRAQEWTTALTRWCDAQPDLVPFRGECLVQRAEILQLHGEWPKALEESMDACDVLTRNRKQPAAGAAFYRQAELHRLSGNFSKAEACYNETAKRGKKPQPGLALLRLAQGKPAVAETSIRNFLLETKDRNKRAELLPAMVSIALAVNKTEEALDAANELCAIAREFNVPYLLAMCASCLGSVYHAKGNAMPALEQLQKALKFWNSLNLPYESARTRELRGIVYMALNDSDNAQAELVAAKWMYEQLGAVPDLARVNGFLNKDHDPNTYGLSLRELQVLLLVTAGKTNKAIADDLFISERTVDRHVSNIFNKLGVASRVEATAFAYTNNMLNIDHQ